MAKVALNCCCQVNSQVWECCCQSCAVPWGCHGHCSWGWRCNQRQQRCSPGAEWTAAARWSQSPRKLGICTLYLWNEKKTLIKKSVGWQLAEHPRGLNGYRVLICSALGTNVTPVIALAGEAGGGSAQWLLPLVVLWHWCRRASLCFLCRWCTNQYMLTPCLCLHALHATEQDGSWPGYCRVPVLGKPGSLCCQFFFTVYSDYKLSLYLKTHFSFCFKQCTDNADALMDAVSEQGTHGGKMYFLTASLSPLCNGDYHW